MRRREFLGALGISAAWPLAARGQQMRRIAILGPAEEPRFSETANGLRRGLVDLGYPATAVEFIERRVPRGDPASARSAAADILASGPSVVFVIGSELARSVRQVSAEIPVMFITPGDPVAAGLVSGLARPGGNTTAMTFEFPELAAKRLELLKTLAPDLRSVLVLYDPRDVSPRQSLAAAREAAPKLGLLLVEREVRNGDEIASGLTALEQAGSLLAIPGGITSSQHADIIAAANAKRRPTIFYSRAGTRDGALASYGASDTNVAREAARLIDKIVKGEDAGSLPVERPSKFELILNLKTAKQLGLAIPPTMLASADDVIE
jgi:putative tryptophan/tyrosine transport system substrate-binding protein